MSAVVLCEKPSQARNISQAVGTRYGVVLSAAGHLVRLESPEEANAAWQAWSPGVLWPGRLYGYKADEVAYKRQKLKAILTALKSADRVIIATDCDREGQSIGDEILALAGYRGEVRRAIFTSEDVVSLQEAFRNTKPNSQYARLYDAARARQQADQIYGLSLTRTVTTLFRPDRGVVGVGRVKTPTLALVCERELAITQHVPRPYFEVVGRLITARGAATVRHVGADRLLDRNEAQARLALLQEYRGPIMVRRAPRQEAPPRPLDLPSLQKRAGAWGWSAQRTLEVAQSLYEQHKLITYPRAETRYLPEVLAGEAPALYSAIVSALGVTPPPSPHPVVRWGKSGVYSDAGLDGAPHHAILPNLRTATGWRHAMDQLSKDEGRLFWSIARSALAAHLPDATWHETTVEVSVGVRLKEAIVFTATDRHLVDAGWRVLLPAPEDKALSIDGQLQHGESVATIKDAAVEAKITEPAPRLNEGGLIAAMQHVWRLVEEEAARAWLKETNGIGTPATRAQIIEGLKAQGLLAVQRKVIVPTPLGMATYQLLRDCDVSLVDVVRTAHMEARLDAVARGKADLRSVVADLVADTERLVTGLQARQATHPTGSLADVDGAPSPALLAAARARAKARGVRLPPGASQSAKVCRDFLGPRTNPDAAPSDAQRALAEKVAGRLGEDVPEGLTARALGSWLDKARGALRDALASDRQVKLICDLVARGQLQASAIPGYPHRIAAGVARQVLDRAFNGPRRHDGRR